VRWTDGEAVVEIAPFPAERRCEITVAAVSAGNELPPGSITIEITGTGTTGAMLPAWAEELRLVSPHGWAPGDLRCLGALVMGLSVGGKTVDLTDACFAEGFHPAEWVEARTARWTDGDAVVMVAPAPVERWCEVEIAAVCGSSDAAAKAA
jgi:hypothetical protein